MTSFHEAEGVVLQANVRHMEVNHLAKWMVGIRLLFIGYNSDEPRHGCRLRKGDIVEVLPENGCGMGIDVVRLPRCRYKTMVWPEEVEIVPRELL